MPVGSPFRTTGRVRGVLAGTFRFVSTETIYTAALDLVASYHAKQPFKTHLDVGSGKGRLIELMKQRFGVQSSACDYTDTLMKLPGQKVEVANLNHEKLPYPDNSFDLVTATEVIEHLEHYRETVREFYRVLKPGGVCILSTPNILNIKSRLRFLTCGFWNLFGPLPVRNSDLYTTGGHINPVSSFYIGHTMMDAGFDGVQFRVDKYQRSSIPALVLFYLPIQFFGWLARNKEVNKYKTIDPHNAPMVDAMNTLPVLLGRTIIVSAAKPK